MTGLRVGYKRVSTILQNPERQLDGIVLDKEFLDKASGKDLNRPEFETMMNFLREGDRLIVHSTDRIARNLDQLRFIVKTLTAKGVIVEFVKEKLIFTGDHSPMSNLLLSIMGALAEFEHSLILERQREGIAIAKAKGKYKGRSKCLSPEQVIQIKEQIALGFSVALVARRFSVSRYTIYNYIKAS